MEVKRCPKSPNPAPENAKSPQEEIFNRTLQIRGQD